jgi:hypothetical protein
LLLLWNKYLLENLCDEFFSFAKNIMTLEFKFTFHVLGSRWWILEKWFINPKLAPFLFFFESKTKKVKVKKFELQLINFLDRNFRIKFFLVKLYNVNKRSLIQSRNDLVECALHLESRPLNCLRRVYFISHSRKFYNWWINSRWSLYDPKYIFDKPFTKASPLIVSSDTQLIWLGFELR